MNDIEKILAISSNNEIMASGKYTPTEEFEEEWARLANMYNCYLVKRKYDGKYYIEFEDEYLLGDTPDLVKFFENAKKEEQNI